jgi:hypothetical protein
MVELPLYRRCSIAATLYQTKDELTLQQWSSSRAEDSLRNMEGLFNPHHLAKTGDRVPRETWESVQY